MLKRETSDVQGAQRSQVVAGRRELERGDWRCAVASFEAAAAEEETAEAVEGLAEAAWWLGDVPGALRARERSYHLYRRCADPAAARLAMLLAVDHFSLRAEQAVAAGWFQRARHLIETLPAAPEHGWLAAWEAHVALEGQRGDVARSDSATALAVGRTLGVLDLEMLAIAQQGLLRVREGDPAGMDLLDEASAAATSGELSDRRVAATTHSYLIDACVAVGDFERVAQWHRTLVRGTDRGACRAILSRCRVDHVPVLLWRGEWAEAEEHLEPLLRQADQQPAPAGRAAVNLAFIRRRQGRRGEAAALLERASATSPRLVQASVTLARAELALDECDVEAARDAAERLVRTVDGAGPWQRARAHEILVRAQLSLGEAEAARGSLAQLRKLAEMAGTDAIRSYASMADGLVAAANGELSAARQSLEDAVQRFTDSGAPFETARTRLELAGTLAALGRPQSASSEAAEALTILAPLGAADAERAQALLERVQHHPGYRNAGPSADVAALSPRELEVLGLLADGRSNREMAQELFLSIRTVERHVSTIYRSLGVSGKTARTAAVIAAVKAGLSAAPRP